MRDTTYKTNKERETNESEGGNKRDAELEPTFDELVEEGGREGEEVDVVEAGGVEVAAEVEKVVGLTVEEETVDVAVEEVVDAEAEVSLEVVDVPDVEDVGEVVVGAEKS